MTTYPDQALRSPLFRLTTPPMLRGGAHPAGRRRALWLQTSALLVICLCVAAPALAQRGAPPPANQTGAQTGAQPVVPAPSPAPAEKPAPPPVPQPLPQPLAGVVFVDDGRGIEPFAGAQEAVRAYNDSGRGKAHLLATTPAKAEEAIRGLAVDHPTIIVVGATAGRPVELAAKDLPDVRFTVIGAAASGPNIRAVLFRDKETDWLGAWLAGRLAGDGSVGFVGLAPDAERRNALCAVAQGLATANRNILLFPDLEAAGIDMKLEPQRGGMLARGQIERGAKVVIMPPGPAGMGAMEKVRDMGALGITRNTGAASLFPRNVLAVQTRRYDLMVQAALATTRESWSAGISSVGLAEKAVELRLNDAVAPPVPGEVRDALLRHTAAIVSGAQSVQDVTADGLCPMPGKS